MEYTDKTIIKTLDKRYRTETNELTKNEIIAALQLLEHIQVLETMVKEISTHRRRSKSYKALIYIVQKIIENDWLFSDKDNFLQETNNLAIDSYMKAINSTLAETKKEANHYLEKLI